MYFTLVSTVFNEAKRLGQTINDLKKQTLQPSEIIITDAGSTDGTYEMLNQWAANSPIPITIMQKHKCNVAEGRNIAIKAAKYDIIASMDFGCRFLPDWLETIITPFSDPDVYVVGGAFSVDEKDQTTLASKADYIMSNGYNINVLSGRFIPSSRSIAYKKSVFDEIGGYCEWLTLAGDDMVFGLQIAAHGYKTVNIPKPCVFWGRHKKAIGYKKEMFRYGLGNGEAHVDFNNFVSYILQAVFRILFVIGFLLLLVALYIKTSVVIPLAIMVFTVYSFRPYVNYLKKWVRFKSAKYNTAVLFYGFYLYEQTKIGYIRGYIKGYFFSTDTQKEEAILLKNKLFKGI